MQSPFHDFTFGENLVFDRYLPLAGLIMLGAAVPALATAAQPAKPAAKPAAQQPPTRAAVLNTMQANFKTIDTNGDGTLSASELQAAEARASSSASPSCAPRSMASSPSSTPTRTGS